MAHTDLQLKALGQTSDVNQTFAPSLFAAMQRQAERREQALCIEIFVVPIKERQTALTTRICPAFKTQRSATISE